MKFYTILLLILIHCSTAFSMETTETPLPKVRSSLVHYPLGNRLGSKRKPTKKKSSENKKPNYLKAVLIHNTFKQNSTCSKTAKSAPDTIQEESRYQYKTIEDLKESIRIAGQFLHTEFLSQNESIRASKLKNFLAYIQIDASNFEHIQSLVKEFCKLSDKSDEAFLDS